MTTLQSPTATDGRLEIQVEIDPAVVMDRVPMRKALLHFRNVGPQPVRIYLPNAEAFRAMISTLFLAPQVSGGRPLMVPEPHPHGYVVTEADFHLLAPGERQTYSQTFTIDPFVLNATPPYRRLAGFEPGTQVRVSWKFENRIRRWPGGIQTADGPTRELFGGQDIPYIWTGELRVDFAWTAPPAQP